MALLEQTDSEDMDKLLAMFESLYLGTESQDENNGLQIPQSEEERKILGKAHLHEAVLSHEEGLRVHDLCKQMRKIDTFRDVLQKVHPRTHCNANHVEEGRNSVPELSGRFRFGANVDQTWKDRFIKKLLTFSDVFNEKEFDLNMTDVVHDIELTPGPSIRERPRPIPPQDLEEVRQHVQQLLDARIIKPSTSSFASPIVLVRKKNGALRMCVDYRRVNAWTVRDSYSLPKIEHLFLTLSGAKVFTSLDLSKAYYQVPLSERAKKISAFTTPFGLYEFQRLPFGLVNAPMTFQRLMDCCLSDMNLAELIIFLDDIPVHGTNLQQLEDRTIRALERNLTLINVFLPPLRRWVPQFAQIAKPLNDFTVGYVPHKFKKTAKKAGALSLSSDISHLWGEREQSAFESLVKALTAEPMLGIADQSQPFILHCDASGTGLGIADHSQPFILHCDAIVNLLVSPPDNVDELVALYNSTLTALLDKFAPRYAKQEGQRQAERRWRKSRLEVDRQIYRHTRSQCSAIIVKARSRYVMNILSSAVSDSRKMFAVVNGLLGKDVTQPILPEMDDQTAASTLSAYFEDKIKTIMDSFSDSVDTVEQTSDLFCGTPLSNFQPVTEDELLKLVRRCSPTTRRTDPSTAVRQPFCLMNDLLCSADAGKVTLVVLLDLSVAFDVIDHSTLLTRLQMEVGIGGSALQWFHSYLSDRTQRVMVNQASSVTVPLLCGVPQGSVLGPVLFSIYTSQLGPLIEKHNVNRKMFADDTELYFSFSTDSEAVREAVCAVEDCCLEVKSCMLRNKLKLNDEKTEAMLCGSKLSLSKVSLDSIQFGGCWVPRALSVSL
ncbi:hypothetical protein C0Q70_20759 [Pomacea canaliculata]|uniref:Reverse transcriptase domain-containing protein n=1 Tax=Pomacea canaliculata TaxID=400727 RepID=A0A2T7NGJ6_POMCA|nr:hypothetical protein C0Q70_20759 [Pomacea canaliculata]